MIGVITFAEQQPEKRVMNYLAVMDLKCGDGVQKSIGPLLTDIIIEELVKSKKYTIIDRANRDKILSEVGFQMTGCADETCTVEAGRLLGVGKLVVGSIDKIDETYVIRLQLINVETAAVEQASSKSCKCDIEGLMQTVRNAVSTLQGASTESYDTSQTRSTISPTNGNNQNPSWTEKIKCKNPEAQKLADERYVLLLQSYREENIVKSIELMESAVKLEPDNDHLWVVLSADYARYGILLPRKSGKEKKIRAELFNKGIIAAKTALSIRESTGAHFWYGTNLALFSEMQGLVSGGRKYYEEMVQHINRAQVLDPDYEVGGIERFWSGIVIAIDNEIGFKMAGINSEKVLSDMATQINKNPFILF